MVIRLIVAAGLAALLAACGGNSDPESSSKAAGENTASAGKVGSEAGDSGSNADTGMDDDAWVQAYVQVYRKFPEFAELGDDSMRCAASAEVAFLTVARLEEAGYTPAKISASDEAPTLLGEFTPTAADFDRFRAGSSCFTREQFEATIRATYTTNQGPDADPTACLGDKLMDMTTEELYGYSVAIATDLYGTPELATATERKAAEDVGAIIMACTDIP